MAEEITDQKVYHNLAEAYEGTKKKSIINLLKCGKILSEAKESMPHGMFGSFLEDTRVSESERTAQRLMAIYRNFRHLLNDPKKKAQAIIHLGVSHLLELQKLPERFKKEIELVKEVEGKEIREIVKVVDEERLADFLDKHVDHEGTQRQVRDLPLSEMKRHIKEAQGIYEPDPVGEKDEPENVNVPDEPKQIPNDTFGEVMSDLAKLSGLLHRLNDKVGDIDTIFVSELTEPEMKALTNNLKKTFELAFRYGGLVEKCVHGLEESTEKVIEETTGNQ